MTTNIAVKEIKLTAEGVDPRKDRRTFSGTVRFNLSGSLGTVEVEAPFYDLQTMDAAVYSAFGELKRFLESAQRALDEAAAEYGYNR